MVKVGKEYFYRAKGGRGRPAVGRAIRPLGESVELLTRSGKLIKVKLDQIGKAYTYKPYNKQDDRKLKTA